MAYTGFFYFLVLIISIIVHEVAHGVVAEREGDPTARLLGRITLNPLKHIDILGSIVLPLVLLLSNAGLMIGWAKPVPYDPTRLTRGKKSVALVASAGIIANLSIAVFFGLLLRLSIVTNFANASFVAIASMIVLVNIILAMFNAIPLAPLDGFTILQSLLPTKYSAMLSSIERYSLPILLLFVIFGWQFVSPLGIKLYTLITGLTVY